MTSEAVSSAYKRIVSQASPCQHHSVDLKDPHWLPVHGGVDY